ncbi:MAG: DUF190 domain-containing protein [Gammaproteobacteria bacterium]
MKTIDVTMVRVYLTEAKAHLPGLMKTLHDEEQVRGVTVFRGISGFGRSGQMHSSTLLDMSLNLPVVVEFFDVPSKINQILEHLNTFIAPGHVVSWPAYVTVED